MPIHPKWQLEHFRSTVANKSELEVCVYLFLIDKHVYYSFHQIKSKPCASFFAQKYTVFTMGGTVPLRPVNIIFPESYSSGAISCQYLPAFSHIFQIGANGTWVHTCRGVAKSNATTYFFLFNSLRESKNIV